MGTHPAAHADLGYLLHRGAKLFRTGLSVPLAEFGITPAQAAVLMALGRAGTPMPHKALAEAIDADPATTSGLLSRLERDGWLRSSPNPSDGRSRIFELTDQGAAILPRVLGIAAATSRETAAPLTADESAALAQLLGKLVGLGSAEVDL